VISEIRPGASTADAAKHFPSCAKWGYKEEEHILCKEIGHGIGLSLYEQPTITRLWSPQYPEIFEEGMVIAVEGREGEHFVGGSRLEEMVVVTATGTELLTRIPAQEMLVAGDMFC
jgi:Xaa-Pro aminopeptidase